MEGLYPPTSVSGPQELVTQVFAVLLEYLKDPDSSPTVQARGAGAGGRWWGGLQAFSRATVAHSEFSGAGDCTGFDPAPGAGDGRVLAEGNRQGLGSHGL